jgi:hypothetical protein
MRMKMRMKMNEHASGMKIQTSWRREAAEKT